MPELPEVETIKNELAPQVTGHRLVGVDLLWPKAVHEPSPEAFCQRLIGQEIMAIWRRGKYLLLLKPGLHLGEQDSGFLSCHAKIIRGILPLKPPKRRSGLGFVKELRPFC
ncbi:hypothetical protein M1N89_01625 [Dehalococcoidia bacterium]|nr:hypothetical protein [Dehalococcoidia bacterium]